LDPKTSRWLSGDPALGEYIPAAPVNDEAKKRNGNLPGQGGVFNYVNLHVYHYAGNNPVKYVDPDGNSEMMIDIFRAALNGSIVKSEFWNSLFPSSNPGSAARHYEKADQSGNPLNVKDALKAGFSPLAPKDAAWHRQGEGNEYNIKMVHKDGREAVYNKDGNLVFDEKNRGTKNDYPAEDFLGHTGSDVLPYMVYGNTQGDKPKGIIGLFDRLRIGIKHSNDIPKDYYQHWDEIYHPENYE
jgi:hypothetical protein